MQSNNQKQSDELSTLLGIVAKKMGKTPEELQRELQSGGGQSAKVKELLGNKEQLNSFMKSPQVQKLLGELKKK